MRLRCMWCGKVVSTEVPDGTIVRAAIECPECVEKQYEYMDEIIKKHKSKTLEGFMFGSINRMVGER